MLYRLWILAVVNVCAGRHPRVREAMGQCAGMGLVYIVATALVSHTAALTTAITLLGFLALIRSGWTRHMADPLLPLPLGMMMVVNTVLAYGLSGTYRADAMVLLAHTLGMAMLRLPPRQTALLALWATACLASVQIGMVVGEVPDFSRERALAQSVIGAVYLLALGLVGHWIATLHLCIQRQDAELRNALQQARVLATTDMLTGLLNRRSMDKELDTERLLAQRTGHPFCLALIDLDHFKRINDRFGHRAGDQVLQSFAQVAHGEFRQVDRLARWGGEEFLVLMPRVDLEQALTAVQRLRAKVQHQSLHPGGEGPVTLSAGVTQCQPGESLDRCFDRADRALYQAKQQGRNRCCVAEALP